MKSLRSLAFALLLAFVCGPALVDPCLFDCHDATATTSVPPCHEVAAHEGLSLAGVNACDHDHDAFSAETAVDGRFAAAHHTLTVAALPQAGARLPLTSAGVFPRASAVPLQAGTRPLDLPLRL